MIPYEFIGRVVAYLAAVVLVSAAFTIGTVAAYYGWKSFWLYVADVAYGDHGVLDADDRPVAWRERATSVALAFYFGHPMSARAAYRAPEALDADGEDRPLGRWFVVEILGALPDEDWPDDLADEGGDNGPPEN